MVGATRGRRDPRVATAVMLLMALGPAVATADITGTVLDVDDGTPVAGARVHLQADPASPVVLTGSDGTFALPVSPATAVVVTAGVPYDPAASRNWHTGGTFAVDGATAVEIRLRRLPASDDPDYGQAVPLVDDCGSCHPDQVAQWHGSVHAGAAVDPWVVDLQTGTGTPGGGAGYVFVDTHDPGETGFCATCHTPMADVFDPGAVLMDTVTSAGALQGVSCVGCHQIADVNHDTDRLHHLGNASYRFPFDPFFPTQQHVWGPLDDVSFSGMRASFAPLYGDSRYCASCHQYVNPDTGAPGQDTYGEWLASPFAVPGDGFRSCQDCHMPSAEEPGVIATIGDNVIRPADQRHRHEMVGATPATLAAAITLDTVASQSGSFLDVRSTVSNVGAGHAFPSGVSIRNAVLVITAELDGTPLVQVAGPTVPFWADDDVPGRQEGDLAGLPGTGFAKVLEGRINGQGPVVRPVLFIDAEGVWEDSLLPAAASRDVSVRFELPPEAGAGGTVTVEARLLYRRAWRALAVTKGWTETPQGGPIEIEVARDERLVALVDPPPPTAIPALGALGLGLLAGLIGLAGWRGLSRGRG